MIDDAVDPVVVHVRGTITHRGSIVEKSNPASNDVDLLIIAYGSATSFVEAPYKGTLFVPSAGLTLQPLNGGQRFGAFFAKDLLVEAGVIIRHQPFPWSKLLPPTGIIMTDSPISLRPTLVGGAGGSGGSAGASGGSSGSGGSGGTATGGTAGSGGSSGSPPNGVAVANFPGGVTFRIPTDLWVSIGNAGHGTAILTLGSAGGTETVCTYTGGSPTNTPVTDLDIAKGRRYLFGTCTGGANPGDTATAEDFELTVVSGATNVSGTSLALHLGGGCSGSIPAAVTPEEVVAMREGFNWRTTEALAATDPEGRPALWHGLIYADRPEQLQALDRWKVYYSAIPLSNTYSDALAGQCGRVEHAGDGKGVLLYGVFPARLYNLLRNFAIQAVLAGAEPPFKFIVPTPPEDPAFVHEDGSIRYSALASSGYADWLATRPLQQPGWLSDRINAITKPVRDAAKWVDDHVIDPVGSAADTGFSYVGSSWDSFVDWTATAIDNGWEEIQLGLGNFLGLFQDEAEVTLQLYMLNRDPLMNLQSGQRTDMIRAWGPNADAAGRRPKLVPRGASVIVRQWGLGFLPVLNRARLGADGRVTIKTLEGASEVDGDGLCFELENDEAMITSDFAANEVCSFLGPGYFQYDAKVDLYTDQEDLHALTQIVDSADYARQVIGWEPSRVDVLTGWAANTITGLLVDRNATVSPFAEGDARAMTLCLDFPFTGPLAIDTLNALVASNVAGALAAPLLLKDMWWPDDRQHRLDSRGLMTHEYGHFLMCDMLYSMAEERSFGAGPPALSALVARVLDTEDDSRDDEAALVTESWADTFAMQVTGGANYINSDNATANNEAAPIYAMGFCTAPHCMDMNYQGRSDYPASDDEFDDELAKLESTIHDAFDRSDAAHRLTLQPWNGDVWKRTSPTDTHLVFSPDAYLGVADEPVSLVGSSWKDWVRGWVARGGHPTRDEYFGGLSDALSVQGFNWCERCEAFAVHEYFAKNGSGADTGDPTFYVPRGGREGFADHLARWKLCQGYTAMQTWLGGGPPEPHLNLRSDCTACGPLEYSSGGICEACPPNQVPRGDHCEPCDAGFVAVASTNSCSTCGPYEITSGNSCVPCPFGSFGNRATNTCERCPVDLTVDVSTFAGCSGQTYVLSPAASELDTCPEDVWVDVVNMSPLGVCTGVAITAGVEGQGSVGQAQCPLYAASLDVFDPAFATVFSASGPGIWQQSPLGAGACRLPSTTSLSKPAVEGGLDAVRLRVSATGQTLGVAVPVPVELTVGKMPGDPL